MKKVLLASLFICLYAASYADGNKPLDPKSNLDSLSKAYFVAGDNTCLLIDAVKDGLIDNLSSPYNVGVEYNKLTVNGVTTSKELTEKYFRKAAALELINGFSDTSADAENSIKMFLRGDCVCDLKEPIRPMPKSVRDYLNAGRKLNDSLMVDRLLAARIISSRSGITINSTDAGIYVNDKKLTTDQEKLLAPYLQRIQFIDDIDQSFVTGKMIYSDPAHTNSLLMIH